MASPPRALLSARQTEIAQLIAAGKTNAEIAATLFLSERTIESHVAALFNKLNVGSRTELVAAVLRKLGHEDRNVGARSNLPLQTSALIGRAGDVTRVGELLNTGRLVTLTGTGGVGKTRAAFAVGDRFLESTQIAVRVVELASLARGSSVAAAVAQALNIQESPGRTPLELLISYLGNKALLLILDNCEHLIGQAAPLADALLCRCPHLRILTTSREPLQIIGEQTYRLPSLAVPTAAEIVNLRAREAATFAAVALFVQRAQAVDHAFTLSDENAPDVAEACRRLDGIPLAIELAAARVKILSVRALARKLDQRFRILTGGARTAVPRHQTMRALIDWSYDLLAPPEQQLFERLSVFAGGWTLETATAVCADDSSDEFSLLELLSSLVDKSLLVSDLNGREPRYRLLESARQYAAERLAERGEAAAVAHRHAAAFADFAERLEREYDLAANAAWSWRTKMELENCRAALTWALSDHGDVLLGQRLAAALGPVWKTFALAEGRRWLNAARQLVDDRTPATVAAHLEYAAADAANMSAQHDAALEAGQRALSMYRALGEKLGIARAEALVGRASDIVRRPAAEIEPLLQSALTAARDLGNLQLVGTVLQNLGLVRSRTEHHSEARVCFREALEIFEAMGAELHAALATHSLAIVEFDAGDADEAVRLGTISLASFERLGFTPLLTKSRNNLAEYLIALNRWDEARAHALETLDLVRETEQADVVIWGLHHLAAIAALSASGTARAGAEQHVAALLLGYVNARLPTIGRQRHLDEQQEYDRALAALRRAMNPPELARLMTHGATLSTNDAVEQARSI